MEAPPAASVVVEFRNAGGAPVLKKEKAKLKLPADKPFSMAILALRKLLSLAANDPLVSAALLSVFRVKLCSSLIQHSPLPCDAPAVLVL